MRPDRRFLLALWLAIQLLASQQLALAHLVGHLGEATRGHAAAPAPVVGDGDKERGVAHTLSPVCTTCVSCLGLDVIAAAGFLPLPARLPRIPEVAAAIPPAPAFRQPLAFLSRAPPQLRN